MYKYIDRIIGANPGSPEPVYDNETGDRYVISLTIDNNELTKIKRLTINTISRINREFDMSQPDDGSIGAFLEAEASPSVSLKLILSGMRQKEIPLKLIESYRNRYYRIDIDDRSSVSLDMHCAEKGSEDSLRGEFFSLLEHRIRSGEIPRDIDRQILADMLSAIMREKKTVTEERLCALFSA